MTGVVIIRTPTNLWQIHRSMLSVAHLDVDRATVTWMHIGETMVSRCDVDVSSDDDDPVDYGQVAEKLFSTIGVVQEDVFWTWNSTKKIWSYVIAPRELPPDDSVVNEAAVGYGSLGR